MLVKKRPGPLLRTGFVGSLAGTVALIIAGSSALADLSPDNASAISTSLSTALTAVTQPDNAAKAAAIQAQTSSLLGQFGPDSSEDVAAAIIVDALSDGASPQAVGTGLAHAALALGGSGGTAIADAVGRSGNADVLAAFDAALSDADNGDELEEEADASASVHFSGFGSVTIGGGVTATGGAGGAPCPHPSCS
jgi:hypothetical protein